MERQLINESGSLRGVKATLISDGSIYAKRSGKYITPACKMSKMLSSAMLFSSLKEAEDFVKCSNMRLSTFSFYRDLSISSIRSLPGGRTVVEYECKMIKL